MLARLKLCQAPVIGKQTAARTPAGRKSVGKIDDLRALLARASASEGASRELDADIVGVLSVLPSEAARPPWSASVEEATRLFKQLLQDRPMDLVH